MTEYQIVPAVAVMSFLVLTSHRMFSVPGDGRGAWRFPAALSLVFLLYSVRVVFTEGPLGFWTEHTRNLWGNQVWLDLLLALGIGWFLIVPSARAQGMRLPLWFALIIASGSIGLLAMLARLLFLRERSQSPREPRP
jgi:hypothetical protein